MIFKKHLLAFSCAALTLLGMGTVASAQTGTVTADVLRIRSSASTDSSVICRLTNGTEIEILSFENNWYHIKLSNGQTGYASGDYIVANPSYYGKVTATSLMVRSSTGVGSPVISKLANEAVVELLAYDGAWYKIKLPDGTEGYASADYIVLCEKPAVQQTESCFGYITDDMVKLHTTTGDYAPVITLLSKDTKAELLAYDGAWYKIKLSDTMTGFVSAAFVAHSPGGIPQGVTVRTTNGYINATMLNIRSSTGIANSVITTLPMGTTVELLAYDGAWYKVKLSDGQIGYASAEYIDLNPIELSTVVQAQSSISRSEASAPPSAETIAFGESIVQTAKEYMGLPYVYAAAGPDSFDCSGFTMYILSLHGINIPHQSGSQFLCGYEVSYSELIAGDLVFFNSANRSDVAHVGIYIGNGNFIHASSGKAYSVTISSLSQDYYSAHYLGARRVI